MDELRKALEIFALRNAEGAVSDAALEKACEAYKARSEFVDDYEYSLYVTKSLYDHLHGVEQDPEAFKVYQEKSAAANKVSSNSVGDPDKDIYAAIYQASRSNDEVLGVYAALRGYDAMIQPNGNHCGNSFMIVFNRSKIITRK